MCSAEPVRERSAETEPGLALWDRFVETVVPRGITRDFSRRGLRLARLKLRTEPYERAADPSGDTGALAARLREEHKARLAYWRAAFADPAQSGRAGIVRIVEPWGPMRLLILLAAVAAVVFLLRANPDAASTLLIVLLPGLLISGFVLFGARLVSRMLNAMDGVACPDCGYDLHDSVPGVPPELLGGTSVGPARCPECGASWPCVPPPAPSSVSAGA